METTTSKIENLTKVPSFNMNVDNVGNTTFNGRVDVYDGMNFLYTQAHIQTARDFRCEAIDDAKKAVEKG